MVGRNPALGLGLDPMSPALAAAQTRAAADAVTLTEYAWEAQAGMPVAKWDAAFDARLAERAELAEKYRRAGYSLLPWKVFRSLPPALKRGEVFAWNQGSLPSCSMHAAAHAYQCATLTAMALGAPLFYDSINPIYPFYWARGGNYAGGLTLFETGDWINTMGLLPVSLVGADNQRVTRDGLAKKAEGEKWQAGLVYLEDDLVEKIFSACRGLCAVCFGSGILYTRSETDSRGVRVMAGMTSGGHAQCFVGYREEGGEEYVFNFNSHGNIYGGDAPFGAWVTRRHVEAYARDMAIYGLPFVVFPEGEFRRGAALFNDFELPRAEGGV